VPGLLGIISTRGPLDAARRFDLVRERMLRHAGMTAEAQSALDGAWRVGRVFLVPRATPSNGPRHPESTHTPLAVFHGVLYNETALRNSLGGAQRIDSLSHLISALYSRYGADFVDHLEGEYALAVADPARATVLVATDHAGNYPVYWRADADGLVFAADLSAVLTAVPAARRLDLQAVADYLTIGAVLGEKTLVGGVSVLEPGSVLAYDADRAQVTCRPYVQLETFFRPKATSKAAYFDEVNEAFTGAVRRATSGDGPIGLSLSGGLDSRAILSAANGQAASLRSYTLGVEGCADQVIARRLAEIAGTQHHYFRLDSSYLRDFMPNMARMVSITDGMYLSHGLTEMLALQFLDETGIAVLLRGHGGELAKAHLAWPLHTDERIRRMSSIDELVPYLSARANYVTPNLPLSRLLTPEAAASAGTGTPDAFSHLLRGKALTPAECCSYLYLRELHRRFTVPSLELFRTRVDVRLPYVDTAFLKVLLAAPSDWRDTTEIHRSLTASGLPKLLKVRNSNTGADVDATPRVEFVLDKVNTALKRLHVRGYRHYHDFDVWMRSMLLQNVEVELLAPESRVQAFVPKPVLQELIRETRDGSADRSYLLQILLILELWQRENGVEAAA
jgi:asparagine synthase (glutamine-hydrolysing)